MYTYPGNIHIHSCYSDGSGTIKDIAAEAAAAGLSFVIISDHETLAGLPEEATHHGVSVVVGQEINRLHSHYLALGLNELIPSNDHDPQAVIDQVNAAGGFGFLAHPFEKGSPYLNKGKAQPWRKWPVYGFQGLEIWNYSSHWRGRNAPLLRKLYWFFFNRKAAMDGPPVEALNFWDSCNSDGNKVVAIGSSDAHAAPFKLGRFKVEVFPYRFTFTTVNTYIVLKEPLSCEFATAKEQITKALRAGSCYVSFDSLQRGNGFLYYAAAGEDFTLMGGETAYQEGLRLHIKTPAARSKIRLLHNGQLIKTARGPSMNFSPSKPGVYRVEVYYRPLLRRPRPWLYSNPIFIR